jgi:endonuclease-3
VSKRRESKDQIKKRAGRILRILAKDYPQATTALRHQNALELLVATILSAQCTDERVNIVTERLFARYKTPTDYAKAPQARLEKEIRETGFFRQKSKSIRSACSLIQEQFGGQVPDTMEELTQLPGVARKTANVVLGTWFGKNEGMAIDTHVGRLAHRLALTWSSKNDKDAVNIEADLTQLIPRKKWAFFSHALILHGRAVCAARKPRCAECKLADLCRSAFTFENARKK